jgi:hypothetical protein
MGGKELIGGKSLLDRQEVIGGKSLLDRQDLVGGKSLKSLSHKIVFVKETKWIKVHPWYLMILSASHLSDT